MRATPSQSFAQAYPNKPMTNLGKLDEKALRLPYWKGATRS